MLQCHFNFGHRMLKNYTQLVWVGDMSLEYFVLVESCQLRAEPVNLDFTMCNKFSLQR